LRGICLFFPNLINILILPLVCGLILFLNK